MRIPIDNLGSVGLVKDIYVQDTPPEAWTNLRNARMGPYGAEKFLGHSKALGTDSAGWTVAPVSMVYVPVAGSNGFWIGAGTNKVYARLATSPFTETNITRQTASVDVDYAANETKKWQLSVFGGLLILNNGVDVPQMWTPPAAATKLAALTAWDATEICSVLRPFGRFLVALDITKGATRYPSLVKWSHPADPGAVPDSWDEANPAKDTGEFPLSDAVGTLVDEQVIAGNLNMLYTTDQVWSMRFVQGGDIFGFEPRIREQGALCTGAVARFKKNGMQHIVLGGDDIYVHDGINADSVITPAMRRWFFNQISPANYARSFVVSNPRYSEVWVCIPESGAEQPTLALVWNWESGSVGLRDLLTESSGSDTRTTVGTQGTPCIVPGIVETVLSESWDGGSGSWDSDSNLWVEELTHPAISRMLMADRSAGKRTFICDDTNAYDGATITVSMEREGLAILGQDRTGKPKVDTARLKQITEIWPRIEAAEGTVVTIEVGVQNSPDEAVFWEGSYSYTVGTTPFVACFHMGRYLSFRFTLASGGNFRLLGYALEITDGGMYL